MSTQDSGDDRSENTRKDAASKWWNHLFGWFRAFDLREWWWGLLDYFEAHRRARRLLYGLFTSFLLVVVLWVWVYPWWTQRNAISMARQWIAAGRLNYAAEAVQKALEKNPREPELWLLAAELARLHGQKSMEVEYAHLAAQAQLGNSKYALEWAGAALRADQQDVAAQVLATVSEVEIARSSIAQRLLGELARRQWKLKVAIDHFETALKIDGAVAIDEIPLGLCLVAQEDAAQRRRGLGLLEKWTTDREWGANALQILLKDAVQKGDRPAMAKWADALRVHPRCTVGDMPNCLSALVVAAPEKFSSVIAQLKQAHLASPETAAQLMGWLDQIGRSAEALEWAKTLPEDAVRRPPLAVSKAESLRLTGDWQTLQVWASQGDWGENLDFLRWAYGMLAARSLGDEKQADDLWHKLFDHAQANGVHALFSGTTVFTWGLVKEAEALWWLVAGQNNNLAVDALGTLARHYQVQRDAVGQYRVFNQLHALHPKDDAVTNNFAFFAALTGNREQLAEQLSRENLARNPANQTYLATHAFVLLMRGRAAEGLRLIKPLSSEAGKSSAVAFVYGLALAGNGEKTKAKAVLETLNPAEMTLRETQVIQASLSD
jgi:tetratricopeptide (TPR) repeat protein